MDEKYLCLGKKCMIHELGSDVCIADGRPAFEGQECRHPEYLDRNYQKRAREFVNIITQFPELN